MSEKKIGGNAMDKGGLEQLIVSLQENNCAMIIMDTSNKIIKINEIAEELVGTNRTYAEILPGRYVENEDFFENLHQKRILFTHKAILKCDSEEYKIRGMVQEVEEDGIIYYGILFEVRDGRILGSVTLERIVEHTEFVAMHWLAVDVEKDLWKSQYVSNTVHKYGYQRYDFYNNEVLWTDFVCPADQKRIHEELLEQYRNKEYDFTREYRIMTKGQRMVPIRDYVHIVTNEQNKIIGMEVIVFDLMAEDQRNEELIILENAVNRGGNTVIVWEFSAEDSKIKYVSGNVKRLGIDPKFLLSGAKSWREYIVEEDRDQVGEVYQQYIERGVHFLSQEYQICNERGELYWIRDEAAIVVMPDQSQYIESLLTDITVTKNRELTLEKQKKRLNDKLRFITSNQNAKLDINISEVLDQNELQELQRAFSELSDSYNAIIDLTGRPITKPTGPNENMGLFYDMFEKREYLQLYFELNKKLKGLKTSASIKLPGDAGVMNGIPFVVNEVHIATWVNCYFDQQGLQNATRYMPSLQMICEKISQYVYSNTFLQKQTEKARCSEIQAREMLEQNEVIRDILKRCNETSDEDALRYVLSRAGKYLNVSRISMFMYKENENPTCWQEWDAPGMPSNIDEYTTPDPIGFARQLEAFSTSGILVLNGEGTVEKNRRSMWDHHIRALISLPIETLTIEKQYITFVESNYDREWTDDEITFAKTLVAVLRGFLQRMRSNFSLHTVNHNVKAVLENSHDLIYIKSADNRIVYANPRMMKQFGDDIVGKFCYQVFRKQSMKCMDCYNHKAGICQVENSRMYERVFGHSVKINETDIVWVNMMHARLVNITFCD